MQAYGRLLFTVFLLGVGGSGIFYLATELFPGRTNPNGLFSEVFDLLRTNNRVITIWCIHCSHILVVVPYHYYHFYHY